MPAQRQEVGRVAEHLAHGNGQELQQLAEQRRVAQHAVLQRRDAGQLELLQRIQHAALLRGRGVVAEVVAVLEVDGLHQQAQLDLGVAQRLGLHGGGGRVLQRGGQGLAGHRRSIFGIHTRNSENRRSRSTGLAR
ncbi:hypothetical protein D3C72_1753080 [compost metagenome]